MKNHLSRLPIAALSALAALLANPFPPAMADADKDTGPQTMECVEIVAQAYLGPDLECNIASSHHRMEQYPEAVFYCDEGVLPDGACDDPMNPCAVKGKLVGTIDGHEFVARAACGFTLNDLGEQADADLATIFYQQFTARTNLGVFLGTTEIPAAPPGTDEVKPSFGLFLGDAGVSNPDFYVSQRMTLTGARKLPAGTKGALDMTGAPPVRAGFGTLCGPNLSEKLSQIARKEKKGENWEDDD